jgi:hypothetical protein
VLENFCVTVAELGGDGLLDMKQNGEEISWPLHHKDQAARYVATPIQSVTVEPMSQALVPCKKNT